MIISGGGIGARGLAFECKAHILRDSELAAYTVAVFLRCWYAYNRAQ